ncbi:MAG TPA: wax ester/triacylglycerol synthase domain-containing protein [Nonomuraea sp.]|nr:wax ester/triacylglycerol synthase domain-containing protein [Nonomuraea sp.]
MGLIDRASPADVAMLAMGAGGALSQRAGAVLMLEPGPGFEVTRASALLAEWIRSVPRLRRRLVRVPFGGGRPVWVDDPRFDLRLHVREVTCPAPGDERALLDVAAGALTGPLPPSRWTAVFVTGLSDGAVALIVVLDHVLADGIGGLALLAALTGPRRTFAVVRTGLAPLRSAAHRHGGTVNDALLTAVTGALNRLLERRGEHVGALSVSVPVSARRSTTSGELGNRFGVMIAALPVTGDPAHRMERIAALLAWRKKRAATASAADLFGPLIRLLAALGLYRRYLRRQRRIHTLVSNVRGPDRPLVFAGADIREIIPVAVSENGNVTVSFEILSYAGTVAITVIADPASVPDLDELIAYLRDELAGIT